GLRGDHDRRRVRLHPAPQGHGDVDECLHRVLQHGWWGKRVGHHRLRLVRSSDDLCERGWLMLKDMSVPGHRHSASDIVRGTLSPARLPNTVASQADLDDLSELVADLETDKADVV